MKDQERMRGCAQHPSYFKVFCISFLLSSPPPQLGLRIGSARAMILCENQSVFLHLFAACLFFRTPAGEFSLSVSLVDNNKRRPAKAPQLGCLRITRATAGKHSRKQEQGSCRISRRPSHYRSSFTTLLFSRLPPLFSLPNLPSLLAVAGKGGEREVNTPPYFTRVHGALLPSLLYHPFPSVCT